jgi:hypothetical protein
MPDESGRKWIVHVGKLIGPKADQSNTDSIAKELGLKKSSLLNSCIRETATNTTRQIIKMIYTPAELERGRGQDVSARKRKLIRGKVFVPKCSGVRLNVKSYEGDSSEKCQ